MKISKQGILAGIALLGSTSAVAAQAGTSSSLLPAPIQAIIDLFGPNGALIGGTLTSKIQTVIYIVLD